MIERTQSEITDIRDSTNKAKITRYNFRFIDLFNIAHFKKIDEAHFKKVSPLIIAKFYENPHIHKYATDTKGK